MSFLPLVIWARVSELQSDKPLIFYPASCGVAKVLCVSAFKKERGIIC